jgi:hypothetical protein
MDPNENLSQQLAIVQKYEDGLPDGVDSGDVLDDMVRLVALVDALHEWIANGGFLPNRWRVGENAKPPAIVHPFPLCGECGHSRDGHGSELGVCQWCPPSDTHHFQACGSCGGCGVLVASWDTLGDSKDGRVFIDTCDECTTKQQRIPNGLNRGDAAHAVAATLDENIKLVRDPGWSFKEAIDAEVALVDALIERWNKNGEHLSEILKRLEVAERERA